MGFNHLVEKTSVLEQQIAKKVYVVSALLLFVKFHMFLGKILTSDMHAL